MNGGWEQIDEIFHPGAATRSQTLRKYTCGKLLRLRANRSRPAWLWRNGSNRVGYRQHVGQVLAGMLTAGEVQGDVAALARRYDPAREYACAFHPMALDAGADVNAGDIKGMTPLMFSVVSDHQDPGIARMLLMRGADRNKRSLAGETALDWARKMGVTESIVTLGSKPGREAYAGSASRPLPDLRGAVQRSIGLLEKSSAEYFAKSGCVACHALIITNFAVGAAQTKGISFDERSARDRVQQLTVLLISVGPALLEGRDPIGVLAGGGIMFAAEALARSRHRPYRVTDVMAATIAAHQQHQGNWHLEGARTPIVDGDFTPTALAIRALKVYGTPGRAPEMKQRIERARQWLLDATPASTGDRNMRLVGVASARGSADVLTSLARPLLAHQHADGGWGQRDELRSDAYATGMTLWALAEAGIVKPSQDAYQRGVRFLLSTQHTDGSW